MVFLRDLRLFVLLQQAKSLVAYPGGKVDQVDAGPLARARH